MDEPKYRKLPSSQHGKGNVSVTLLLRTGIKTTNRSGESVLVLRPVKGRLARGFMEVQCSDFQTFKSLLNIWILGPRTWNLD